MKVYIKSSQQHGQGVFASEPIHAGESIIEFTGPLLTRAQINDNDFHLQIGPDLYLGASGNADDFVNHSCTPNAGFRNGLVLTALRDIEAEEEVTWDYSTAIDEADFPGFTCRCGATHCRGIVRSFRHLEPEIRKQLRSTLLPYLREIYYST